ncbi:SpoIIE family protein phosphatase [candidate division KSB1 bacterium]|nr:SpoIIE family protein phosphatase [candidate division KSB1 bacterium]
MKKVTFKADISLLMLAIIGLGLFSLLIDNIHPFKAFQFKVNRNEAIESATKFLNDRGFSTDGFRVTASIDGNGNIFSYFQNQVGLKKAVRLFRHENLNLLSFHWNVFWYKNAPRSAPQHLFWVHVSPEGHIMRFFHSVPDDYEFAPPSKSKITQQEALNIVRLFLSDRGIDIDSYTIDEFSSQNFEKRTDHEFHWKRSCTDVPGDVKLFVKVQGDNISEFSRYFELPKDASLVFKQQESNIIFIGNALLLLFVIFALFPIAVFLKKYHAGEVGVKSGSVVFLVLWIALVIRGVLAFPVLFLGWSIGELAFDMISVVKLTFSIIIIYPFLANIGFTSWSVGESLAREKWGEKLAAVDALLNKRFATLNFAKSALRGYGFGFVALGLTAVITWVLLQLFKGSTGNPGYGGILPFYLPFLVPLLSAFISTVVCELLFRLFANLFIQSRIKSKFFTVLLSAAVFSLASFIIWDIALSLRPVYIFLIIAFVNGLLFGYVFWKYDLTTVLFANFTVISTFQVMTIVTNGPGFFWTGLAAVVLLLLPVVLIIRGYIKRDSFNYNPDTTPEHIKRISERVRMTRELEIARQVQLKLLPKDSPKMSGCELAGICIPAKEVGGDYYDFIHLGKNKVGIAIGDVSGKGVPAAIYMTLTKGVFQSHAEENVSPKKVLSKVNHLMFRTIENNYFVSLFYAIIDLDRKKMIYARAGHNPAIYFSRASKKFSLLESSGIALGLESGVVFEHTLIEKTIHIQTGDLLVLYTDGFTEAMDRHNNEYTEERLVRVVEKNSDLTAKEIINAVCGDVKVFVKDHPQHDDMTMVVVKFGFNGSGRLPVVPVVP